MTSTDSPSLTWRGKLGWLVVLVVAILLLFSSFFVTASLGIVTMLVVGFLVVAQVAFTAGLIYYPYRGFRSPGPNIRAVEESARREFVRLCADYQSPVRGAWVTDELRHAYGFAQVFGLMPGNRHLFLDTTFFDLYTPDERRAVIARETKLATSYYFFFAQTLALLVVLIYFGIKALTIDSWVVSRWPFVPELLALLLLTGGVWMTRQKVYRADEFAAEQTSVETVVSVLEKFASEKRESDSESAKIALLSAVWTRPSPEKRIDRLHERKAEMAERASS